MHGLKKGGDGAPPQAPSPARREQTTQEHSSTKVVQNQNTKMLEAALGWLARSISVIPLQPCSKRIVQGFGPRLQHVTSEDEARFWFGSRSCNLAIVTGNGLVVLDFDTLAAWEAWRQAWPVLAATYTERTARGMHVFLAGDSASGQRQDFEVKGVGAVVMSAPSVHPGGYRYSPIEQHAAIAPIPPVLSLLSVPLSHPPVVQDRHGDDLIARIKDAVSILDLAQSLTTLTSKNGRWWHGLCPLHGESRPSFWIDAKRGLFGCYSCKVHGDVVNLYALAHGISNTAAIAALAEGVQ